MINAELLDRVAGGERFCPSGPVDLVFVDDLLVVQDRETHRVVAYVMPWMNQLEIEVKTSQGELVSAAQGGVSHAASR